ncbi:MAG: cob(I)yrinic acid a,c-diamide adenosyltransferase [Victivallaceae bacterium]
MIESKILPRAERRGLLLTITGDGKGKTTSALGTAIRALGWGWRVKFIQFVKDGFETGEKRFFARLNFPELEWEQCGSGMSWEQADHAGAAQHGWATAREAIASGRYDLVVLDELNIALRQHWLAVDDVVETLKNRPPYLHVIVTGRTALPEILAISDLISRINEEKHPFHQGILAQNGIDY